MIAYLMPSPFSDLMGETNSNNQQPYKIQQKFHPTGLYGKVSSNKVDKGETLVRSVNL